MKVKMKVKMNKQLDENFFNLNYISLLYNDKLINNRLGYHTELAGLLKIWNEELKQFCKHVAANKFPVGYAIFVPDFFGINFGKNQIRQQKEIDFLYRSVLAVRKVLAFQAQQNQVRSILIYKPYPGTLFIW